MSFAPSTFDRASSAPTPATGVNTTPMAYPVVVLAAEDAQMRGSLSDLLAAEGFLVREVCDAAGVESAIAAEHPSAVVLDLNVSDAEDASILMRLAGSATRTHTILISSSPHATALARAHRVELVQSPFATQDLLRALLVPLEE